MTCFWYGFISSLASLGIFFAAIACASEEETNQENLEKLANANNFMALNVLHHLSTESTENIFFSPLSLSAVLGMLYYGSNGETAKELENALGYENALLPEELVHQTFQQYLTILPSQDPTAYTLNAANSILLDKSLNLDSFYKRTVEELYQASVRIVDFERDNYQIVEEMNSWVKNKTSGKIDKVLDELDPATVLVLLNAVYFKGTWRTQFEPRKTKLQRFYNNGLESEETKVPMMRLTGDFPHIHTDDAKVIELPYKGRNISMIILLPDRLDGLEFLIKSLTSEKLSEIMAHLRKVKVRLSLPKFKVEYSREMSNDFKSLAVSSIFAPEADFSGMTSSNNIYVSQITHKAVIEVNEEGSVAAAVTRISMMRKSRPRAMRILNFVVDRPFFFTIVDKRNGMILFMGRINSL